MNLAGKRVLITGGTGFIGSHLAELLVKSGSQVRVLANYKSMPSCGNLDYVDPYIRDEIEIVWGDVTDRDSVMNVVDGVSVVFHLSALIGIPYSYIAPLSYVQTNINGTLNILQACRQLNIERLVHTSTSETFGSAQYTPMDEKHPLVGQSPYSATKLGADKLAESFACSFDLPVVTVRPFNVFGPRQSDRAIIPTIIAQRIASDAPVRIGDPSPRRDFTFVTDTARGFIAAAQCDDAIGRTFNIGNGKSISIGELAETICELTGGGTYVSESQRIRPKKSEVNELRCDSTLARTVLGWSPEVSLTDGLVETIEFMRSHTEMYAPLEYRV
ncbi:MAG TPA: GDP-mannose 4,6-dehydratase [Phycisphaerae bacterium]|nr:GDP-mannose 4,6-dehydratase [Phycisphaerae bacterium]